MKDEKNDESKSNFSFGSAVGIIVLGIGMVFVGLGFVFLVFWRLQRRRNEVLSEQDKRMIYGVRCLELLELKA